ASRPAENSRGFQATDYAFGGTMRRVVTPEAARFKRRYATRKFPHIFRGLKPTAMVGPRYASLNAPTASCVERYGGTPVPRYSR
ncbi:MAG: hypothetical protein ACREH8_07805, partial [Opitutaceae bacterium]